MSSLASSHETDPTATVFTSSILPQSADALIGEVVKIHSLKNATTYNGRFGCVMSYNDTDCRFKVVLLSQFQIETYLTTGAKHSFMGQTVPKSKKLNMRLSNFSLVEFPIGLEHIWQIFVHNMNGVFKVIFDGKHLPGLNPNTKLSGGGPQNGLLCLRPHPEWAGDGNQFGRGCRGGEWGSYMWLAIFPNMVPNSNTLTFKAQFVRRDRSRLGIGERGLIHSSDCDIIFIAHVVDTSKGSNIPLPGLGPLVSREAIFVVPMFALVDQGLVVMDHTWVHPMYGPLGRSPTRAFGDPHTITVEEQRAGKIEMPLLHLDANYSFNLGDLNSLQLRSNMPDSDWARKYCYLADESPDVLVKNIKATFSACLGKMSDEQAKANERLSTLAAAMKAHKIKMEL